MNAVTFEGSEVSIFEGFDVVELNEEKAVSIAYDILFKYEDIEQVMNRCQQHMDEVIESTNGVVSEG
jgi:hypothetical protein